MFLLHQRINQVFNLRTCKPKLRIQISKDSSILVDSNPFYEKNRIRIKFLKKHGSRFSSNTQIKKDPKSLKKSVNKKLLRYFFYSNRARLYQILLSTCLLRVLSNKKGSDPVNLILIRNFTEAISNSICA